MSLFSYYLHYLTAICEGDLTVPQLTLTQEDPAKRAMELQKQIAQLGIPDFVRMCAKVEGTDIPDQVYEEFDPAALADAMRQVVAQAQPEGEAPAPVEEADPGPRQNAYEALLDCVCLEDRLLDYLIEVLKANDGLGFFRLSQVTARRELKLADFLYWFGTKELYADAPERACVTIMDACFQRLAQEGQLELVAALLSGDEKTFSLFRCDAPELVHLPEATYRWYEEYYLNRYYPIRTIMKLRGVIFPTLSLEDRP